VLTGNDFLEAFGLPLTVRGFGATNCAGLLAIAFHPDQHGVPGGDALEGTDFIPKSFGTGVNGRAGFDVGHRGSFGWTA